MKKILLILLIGFFSFQGFGQGPDPELFRTWYLRFVLSTDLNDPYEVSEISPAINPFITISEDLSFSGEGACNTFTGVYEYFDENTLSAINSFNETNEDCGSQAHNSFETHFFSFIANEFWYEITQESDGLTLTASNMLMGYAIFKEFPLSTSEFIINDITIYPNPVSDKLFISSENTVIEKISVYSLTGRKVAEVVDETNSIDVSNLSKGIYFIEISSTEGKTVKKFIKK